MPQFDFNTYPSQIFWFALCFITLYLFSYFIILPRIKKIFDTRNQLINSEKTLAEELALQCDKINNEAQENIQKANLEYVKKIENIVKNANLEREKSLSDLKNSIDDKVKNSRHEIKEFIKNSINNNTKTIEQLANNIKNKIIN